MTAVASDIMKPAVTAEPSTRLQDIATKMETLRISIVPVVSKSGDLVGVVSKTDLIHVMLSKNDNWDDLCAEQAMSPAVVSCVPTSSLSEVSALMKDNKIHHVLVTSDDGTLNVISALDLTAPLLEAYELLGQQGSR